MPRQTPWAEVAEALRPTWAALRGLRAAEEAVQVAFRAFQAASRAEPFQAVLEEAAA